MIQKESYFIMTLQKLQTKKLKSGEQMETFNLFAEASLAKPLVLQENEKALTTQEEQYLMMLPASLEELDQSTSFVKTSKAYSHTMGGNF